MESKKKVVEWQDIKAEQLNLKYSPNYLSKEQADELFDSLEKEVQYFSGSLTKVRVFGKWHEIPRQQVAYGDPGLCYKFSGLSVPALPWPKCLIELRDKISNDFGYFYNFVLVNRYRNGNDNMGEHRDDEAEIDVDAGIVTISLGQVRDFVMRHRDQRARLRVVKHIKMLVDHGSLLQMLPPTNKYWYHSVPVRKKASGIKINLTFKKVNILPEKRGF